MIPIIQNCINAKTQKNFVSQPNTPFAVIIGPTRELMHQIYEQALKLSHGSFIFSSLILDFLFQGQLSVLGRLMVNMQFVQIVLNLVLGVIFL